MTDRPPSDRKVAIESESNRDEFEPRESRLFWAIDTGTMYLGDGEHWNDVSSRPAQSSDGTLYAPPGEVQSKINEAENTSNVSEGVYTIVSLRSNTMYDPDRTWKVKRGVILDFSGATVRPSTDRDVMHLYPDAQLVRPRIDLRDIEFSSNVITLDTAYDGHYGLVVNKTGIRDGHIIASPGQGTAIQIRETKGGSVVNPEFEMNIQGFDKTIDIYAEKESSFINSVSFQGSIANYRVGIHQRGKGKSNGNLYQLHTQPFDPVTETLWKLDGNTRYNILEGQIWDPSMYSDYVWKISESSGGYNCLFNRLAFLDHEHIKNDSEPTNGLVNMWRLTTNA